MFWSSTVQLATPEAAEIRNGIKEKEFHQQTDRNIGKVYFCKFEGGPQRLTEETTAEWIPDARTTVRVTVFPSFIVTEISDALGLYHDGVNSE
jgi:hypothetical protein